MATSNRAQYQRPMMVRFTFLSTHGLRSSSILLISGAVSLILREPFGTVFTMAPFNFGLTLSMR
jgi:acyl-CoA reductase-like NAD-dependent aldehyde dehydrogenase